MIQKPTNEPPLSYAPESAERSELKKTLVELRSKVIEIPLIIGGNPVKTGDLGECRCPHEHAHLLANYHNAGEDEVKKAIETALAAREKWSAMEWTDRAAIFLKAAELLWGPYRQKLNAATMLCQSKNVFQAEIDAACELVDFWRFNVFYMQMLYKQQPDSSKDVWNRSQYRPLEGFVYAISPFNFTAIGGNLATSPALMGNVVVWKPASAVIYSNYFIMEILKEAGLPDGVINFIPGRSSETGNIPLVHPQLGGLHFTAARRLFARFGKQSATTSTHTGLIPESWAKLVEKTSFSCTQARTWKKLLQPSSEALSNTKGKSAVRLQDFTSLFQCG